MKHKVIQGNNIDTLKTYPDNHFDSIVTDPPYGIEFLGKAWDNNTGAVETWAECLRVLKPGGYLLAFSAARTYHHLATNIEGVGFEIRDQLMWLYSSGFPKAQDVGKAIQKRIGVEKTKPSKGMNGYAEIKDKKGKEKWMNPGNITAEDYPDKKDEIVCTSPEAQQWAGWKTALKPAHEPIVMARKPFKGSAIDNVLTHGVGALNIDATRVHIPQDDETYNHFSKYTHKTTKKEFNGETNGFGAGGLYGVERKMYNDQGRFPSNVLGEVEGYQQYFYCPKVSRKERHTGFEDPGALFSGPRIETLANDPTNKMRDAEKFTANSGNNHPTVKPVELMKYLIKLVTPPGGTVLDPFCGSGSTGMAAVELGHTFVGCELDPAYVDIANTRITAWNKSDLPDEFFE